MKLYGRISRDLNEVTTEKVKDSKPGVSFIQGKYILDIVDLFYKRYYGYLHKPGDESIKKKIFSENFEIKILYDSI